MNKVIDQLLESGIYTYNDIYEMDILGYIQHFVDKQDIEEKQSTKTSLIAAFRK